MVPQELIRRKRDGESLSGGELADFIAGVSADTVTEGQIAAFCMAVYFKGLTLDERVALTQAMTRSGRVMNWRALGVSGPILDKHSTGGVGDKTSLVLAPLVAACGGYVPMVAGRGLGHTGGTLDKLESIPGYLIQPGLERWQDTVRQVGCAIIGAGAELAPADRRMYAVRDTTATVESLDLITASILSKKLAAGLDALVMDIKFGQGAFMSELSQAQALANSIEAVAKQAGLRTSALLTDMNQVLGTTAGNALEVRECIDWLAGGRVEARLAEVTLALAARLLVMGGLTQTEDEARRRCEQALASGAAAERFARMVAMLGGPADIVERASAYLPAAPIQRAVPSPRTGYITRMDVRGLGLLILELGGGRTRPQDRIDPSVGLSQVVALGQVIDTGQPLAIIHAQDDAQAQWAAHKLTGLIDITESAPVSAPVVNK